MIRRSLSIAGAALAAFHIWLFAGQLWNGALADPSVIVRWLVAAGLVAGLVALKRQRESLIFGRKAIAIWVLAAVLHGPALAARLDVGSAPIPDVVVTLTQTAVGLVGLLGLGLFFAGAALVRPAFVAGHRQAVRTHANILVASGGLFAPRPPPALA